MKLLIELAKGCAMGLLFIMFLPAVGFVLTGQALWKKLVS
jgi:hypothetical protein